MYMQKADNKNSLLPFFSDENKKSTLTSNCENKLVSVDKYVCSDIIISF
jgi:hypothetical protein